ncbi:MAG: hypothetical protein GEV07_21245 [Streptosporangiales bacterium]|nr:hypothetical protein [Streptosporangiales bacterium]
MSESDSRPVSGEDFDFGNEADEAELTDSDLNEADAAEQHQLAGGGSRRAYRQLLPDDVDPADAADQYREVELDEDDYR